MFIWSRRVLQERSTLAALTLSAASFVVTTWLPIGAIAWIVIEALALGERWRYSFWNAIAFAIFMALFGTSADWLMVRFIFKKHTSKKGLALLYGANFLAAGLPIALVLAWALVYPPEIIA